MDQTQNEIEAIPICMCDFRSEIQFRIPIKRNLRMSEPMTNIILLDLMKVIYGKTFAIGQS